MVTRIYARMSSSAIEHSAMETSRVANFPETGVVCVSTCLSPPTLRERTANRHAPAMGSSTKQAVASSLGQAEH